jgi:ubiquitin carboxyl-terminal hydrolase 5/13
VVADIAVPTQCTECELTGNLWLCLVCGLAHCGRKQFGGVDGNSHALKHKEETGHAVAVKLGTITAEGTAGTLLGSPYYPKLNTRSILLRL